MKKVVLKTNAKLLILVLFISANVFSQNQLSGPFSAGFIGVRGTSDTQATGINTFATLGIAKAFLCKIVLILPLSTNYQLMHSALGQTATFYDFNTAGQTTNFATIAEPFTGLTKYVEITTNTTLMLDIRGGLGRPASRWNKNGKSN